MKTIAIFAVVLALGGASMANAAPPASNAAGNVPLCSRTVTDECMNPSQAPRAASHHAHHHRATASAHAQR
jgi:hypothetical protein